MKTLLLVLIIPVSTPVFAASSNPQFPGEDVQVQNLFSNLESADSNPDAKLKAAWELGLLGPKAGASMPALVEIVEDPAEHPKARTSALNAIGHIGVRDEGLSRRITRALMKNPKAFGGSGGDKIVNNGFELLSIRDDGIGETGAFGETMFQPGSIELAGWTTYEGVTMLQDEGARPGGKNSLELGPRDIPGSVSQTVSTVPDKTYEVKFHTCTGRAFAHFNRQLRLRVGDIDRVIDCAIGDASEPLRVPFTTRSAFTTVTFSGVGSSGFGPVIDEVTIEATDGSSPEAELSDASRRERLDAIARRIGRDIGSEGPQRPRVSPGQNISPDKTPGGIDLMSEAGRVFVGHQLEFFDRGDDGSLGTKKPSWINLYHTEGREFTLTGEVSLGGAYEKMLFPGDLPDGFALFIREWGGLFRYQFDSRNVRVKRRLLHGQGTSNIIPIVELTPPHRQGWIPFKIHATEETIEYSFAGNITRLPGPLDTDGANKIAIVPGTRLRNLRLSLPNPSKLP